MADDFKARMVKAEIERIIDEQVKGLSLIELVEYNLALLTVSDLVQGMRKAPRLAVLNTLAQYEALKQGLDK